MERRLLFGGVLNRAGCSSADPGGHKKEKPHSKKVGCKVTQPLVWRVIMF